MKTLRSGGGIAWEVPVYRAVRAVKAVRAAQTPCSASRLRRACDGCARTRSPWVPGQSRPDNEEDFHHDYC